MGKIVKYCSSCDEGFAEKFGFCPDCGAPLQAFEMNPVENETETVSAAPMPVEPEFDATPAEIEPEAPEPVFLRADEEASEIVEPDVEEIEEEASVAAAPVFYQSTPMYADEPATNYEPFNPADA